MFSGVNDAKRKIKKVKDNITGDALLNGMLEVGEKGVSIWKQGTPVVSGRLINSESYTIANKVYNDNPDAVNRSSDVKTLYIGTNVIYGPSVEYTSKTGSKGFTLRAYRALKSICTGTLANALRKGIR